MLRKEPEATKRLLWRLAEGHADAEGGLFAALQGELRGLAHHAMADQPGGHTLQTTALVNEAWLRIGPADEKEYEGRRHFLRVAARAMRSVLIDHARAAGAAKRGGGPGRKRVETELSGSSIDLDLVLDLDAAVVRLSEIDPELARIAELRCFAGLTNEETATVCELSTRSIERAWRTARAWLQRELEVDDGC